MKNIYITGTAGFIGFHLANLLLNEGFYVHGFDGLTNYYDVDLKKARQNLLLKNSNFSCTNGMLEDFDKLQSSIKDFQPDIVIHLAAQAGVRYSLENPKAYIDSNLVGTFNVLESAKIEKIKHLLIASTSSVYGSNENMPFTEIEKADSQLTLYAATKKANECMSHSYSHLWNIPTTMFRFFTVYGPWGRPDMALFKFVSAMINDQPIDVYNNGEMIRDFTYVEDIVQSIRLLIDKKPVHSSTHNQYEKDSISNSAPFRVVNIGNSSMVNLMDFIKIIEETLGKKAIYNYMPMQKGDVKATWADTTLLKELTNFKPHIDVNTGIKKFIEWYLEYYKVKI